MLPIRTTKRPVPLEHCLFYSGELYKICEGDAFLPQGLRAAKDAYKRKSSSIVGGKSGTKSGAPTSLGATQVRQPDNSGRGKIQKHSKHQVVDNLSGTSGGHQNSWRRSESSLWLLLINKLSKKSLLPVCLEYAFSCYI